MSKTMFNHTEDFEYLNLEDGGGIEVFSCHVNEEVTGLLHQHDDSGSTAVVCRVGVHKTHHVHQWWKQRPRVSEFCVLKSLMSSFTLINHVKIE